MHSDVVSRIKKVEAKYGNTEFKNYIDSFKFDCHKRNLTPKTISCYLERLDYLFTNLLERNIRFKDITRKIIQDYIIHLKGNVSDETINGRLRVYRKFFNYLTEEELWDGVSPMKGVQLLRTIKKVKPVIEPEYIQKMISSLKAQTFEANRNKVMILLFWDGMLRMNELRSLKLDNIDMDTKLIKVLGKGRKERMVPLGAKTLRALHNFIIKWRSNYPGEYLICMRNGEPLSERYFHKVIQRIGQKVGIKLYPHLLRHSAATWYIQQGGNPAVLQKILGHTSLLVTQNYLHLSNTDTVNSYESFSPSNCLRL